MKLSLIQRAANRFNKARARHSWGHNTARIMKNNRISSKNCILTLNTKEVLITKGMKKDVDIPVLRIRSNRAKPF
jgi:hypothetical protein